MSSRWVLTAVLVPALISAAHVWWTAPASGQSVVATIPVECNPRGVAINPRTNRLYVTNTAIGRVTVIDAVTHQVIATVPVPAGAARVAINASTNRIYVSNYFGFGVTVIDGITHQVIATVPIDGATFGLEVNPSTNRIYVGINAYRDRPSSDVKVIDGATNQVIATVETGNAPIDIAVNSLTNRIYVANPGANTVSVINGTNHTVIATFTGILGASGVAVNPATKRLYVTSQAHQVLVIDTETHQTIATIPAGNVPNQVAVDPTTNRIYVIHIHDNNVIVIDGATNLLLASIPVADGPFDVAANPGTSRVYVLSERACLISVIESPNTVPDCSNARAVPSSIRAGKQHRLVPVSIAGVTDADGEPVTIRVTRVTQDEPLNGRHSRDDDDDDDLIVGVSEEDALVAEGHRDRDGDRRGNGRCPDAVIDRSGGVALRAERLGQGNGRVYTIWFTATDARGESCEGSVQACVPHDRRRLACVDDGQRFNSLGPCPERRSFDRDEAAQATLTALPRTGKTHTLEYSLPEATEVLIAVYDVSGRRVATVEHGPRDAGVHEVSWNASSLADGMYFYRLRAGSVRMTRTVLILK